jgi:hypothetical protein
MLVFFVFFYGLKKMKNVLFLGPHTTQNLDIAHPPEKLKHGWYGESDFSSSSATPWKKAKPQQPRPWCLLFDALSRMWGCCSRMRCCNDGRGDDRRHNRRDD